ncbi:MAG: type I-B CRISPR-associated protein Cas7/Csh2 [Promethearchaeota archaeon]
MNSLNNRYEMIFIYDVRDANPNGDPDESNKPRIDDETEQNIVTDLRLKRTIRDYWLENGENVLVRAEIDKDGNRKSMDALATDFLNSKGIKKVEDKNIGTVRELLANELPKDFIDVRAFGAAITLKKANFSHTGAVQFGLGRSLNIPNIKSITITSTLASGEQKGQGSIGEYHIVDYSIIKFHGIISEVNAKKTFFSNEDIQKLYRAIWNGTKQLDTRSKFNHSPRLLVSIKSKEGKPQIGDLDLYISLANNSNPKAFKDVELDISEFIDRICYYKDIVEEIAIVEDKDLKFILEGKQINSIKSAIEQKCKEISIININI